MIFSNAFVTQSGPIQTTFVTFAVAYTISNKLILKPNLLNLLS